MTRAPSQFGTNRIAERRGEIHGFAFKIDRAIREGAKKASDGLGEKKRGIIN
jgi:hypothetical protein